MRSSIKRALEVAFAIVACASTGQAATQLTYGELRAHLTPRGGGLDYRGFTITTIDGKKHRGRRLQLEADHVRLFHTLDNYEDLGAGEVSRIEIR